MLLQRTYIRLAFRELPVCCPFNCNYGSISVRHLILSYFPEDGTLQLSEPPVENSGLPQGQFLRRQRMEKPDKRYYGPEDFVPGRDIQIFSRILSIVGMDDFTRRYHVDRGLEVGEEGRIPEDPFALERKREIENEKKPLPPDVIRAKVLANVMCGGSELNRKVKQYLEKDGKVLRFYCYWDDESEDGYRHLFHLHYFLADDTIELIEIFPGTGSCAACRSLFLKRGASSTISVGDLLTGKEVKIGSQTFFLYDCDKFTRDYFESEYEISQTSFPLGEEKREVPRLPVPPPTGYGTEEDSLASCGAHLIPRRACSRVDGGKSGLAGIVLRYEARLKNANRIDKNRKFIMGFYPVDDSIAVWEIPMRNSGIIAGKFAERGLKKSPDGNPYTLNSLYEGASVTVSGIEFEIMSPDEFTKKYRSKA